MSNRQARRERKLAQRTTGTGYVHTPKEGTPFLERHYVTQPVRDGQGKPRPRSEKRITRWLKDRGIIREA